MPPFISGRSPADGKFPPFPELPGPSTVPVSPPAVPSEVPSFSFPVPLATPGQFPHGSFARLHCRGGRFLLQTPSCHALPSVQGMTRARRKDREEELGRGLPKEPVPQCLLPIPGEAAPGLPTHRQFLPLAVPSHSVYGVPPSQFPRSLLSSGSSSGKKVAVQLQSSGAPNRQHFPGTAPGGRAGGRPAQVHGLESCIPDSQNGDGRSKPWGTTGNDAQCSAQVKLEQTRREEWARQSRHVTDKVREKRHGKAAGDAPCDAVAPSKAIVPHVTLVPSSSPITGIEDMSRQPHSVERDQDEGEHGHKLPMPQVPPIPDDAGLDAMQYIDLVILASHCGLRVPALHDAASARNALQLHREKQLRVVHGSNVRVGDGDLPLSSHNPIHFSAKCILVTVERRYFETWIPWGLELSDFFTTRGKKVLVLEGCKKGSIASESAQLRKCVGMALVGINDTPVHTIRDLGSHYAFSEDCRRIDLRFLPARQQSHCADAGVARKEELLEQGLCSQLHRGDERMKETTLLDLEETRPLVVAKRLSGGPSDPPPLCGALARAPQHHSRSTLAR
eukprot:gene16860-biopygen2503